MALPIIVLEVRRTSLQAACGERFFRIARQRPLLGNKNIINTDVEPSTECVERPVVEVNQQETKDAECAITLNAMSNHDQRRSGDNLRLAISVPGHTDLPAPEDPTTAVCAFFARTPSCFR